MSTSEHPRFPRNTTVRLKPGYAGKWGRTVFTVDRYLKVNLQVNTPDGGKLRGRPEMFERASDVPVAADGPGTGAQVSFEPLPPIYDPLPVGSFVTVSHPRWNRPADLIYVVLKNRGEKVAIAQAGGDTQTEGSYWPGIPRSALTRVHPTVTL
jgi:hypothetical protein